MNLVKKLKEKFAEQSSLSFVRLGYIMFQKIIMFYWLTMAIFITLSCLFSNISYAFSIF